MTFQSTIDNQSDLFSFFTEESASTNRPAVLDAKDHPLYQCRSLAMVSDEIVAQALAADATSKRIMSKGMVPAAGDIVGVRLNLNVFKSQGVAVQTIHAGNRSDGYTRNKGLYNGSAVTYQKVVSLANCYFNVSQKGREQIASGEASKFPMASCDGAFMEVEPQFDGIEISFNPKRVRLFCDSDNRPIRFAEWATVYANRIYVRGRIEYYTADTAPEKVGTAPCSIIF